MVMHWNEFHEENDMIAVGQAYDHKGTQELFQPKLH